MSKYKMKVALGALYAMIIGATMKLEFFAIVLDLICKYVVPEKFSLKWCVEREHLHLIG